MSEQGRLVICGTPIGNLGDISERLRMTLAEVDLIYAEDTRRTAKLLNHIGLSTPLRSLFSGNEKARTAELVANAKAGKQVALVSDAGMPSVSDPGSEAVSAARTAGIQVDIVPGPSAVTTAIALAGFGGDRFVFEGFLPRKQKERARRLETLVGEDRPVVIFASPNRLVNDLESLRTVLGDDRAVSIQRELTKLYEEVWTGTLVEAIAHWTGIERKGEFTVVVAPGEDTVPNLEDAVADARRMVANGSSLSASARAVADATGLSRRKIYEALVSDQALI